MKKHVKTRDEFVNEGIIDDQGAKAIAGWFKTEDEPKHAISIADGDNIVTLKTNSRQQTATLEMICMQNGLKYKKERL